MKALFLFVLLFSAAFASAQNGELHILAEFANQINSGKREFSSSEQFQCRADGTSLTTHYMENLAQQCVLKLCGKPKDHASGIMTDFNLDQYVEQEKFTPIWNRIEGRLREMIEMDLEDHHAMIQQLKQNPDPKPDFPEDYNFDEYARRFFDQYIVLEVDKSKPWDQRLQYTLLLPEGVDTTFKEGIEEYAIAKKRKQESQFHKSISEQFYTFDEQKDLLRQKWDEFYLQYLARKEAGPDFMREEAGNIEDLREKIEGNQLFNIASTNSTLSNYFYLISPPPSQRPSRLCGEKCSKAIQRKIENYDFKKLIREFEQKNAQKESLVRETLAHCKSNIAYDFLKDAEIQKMREMIPIVEKYFLENVFSNYSEESKKNLRDYLANHLHYAFENPSKFEVNDLESSIERQYQYKKNFRTPPQNRNYSSLDILNYVNNRGKIDPLLSDTTTLYLCNRQGRYTAWDKFILQKDAAEHESLDESIYDKTKDNISVSLFSITHPNYGRLVMAHELGHLLSNLFHHKQLSSSSYQKYLELRQCVAQPFSVKHYENPLIHEGDTYFTEEDMADIISYMAIPDKSTLLECTILTPADGESYLHYATRPSNGGLHSNYFHSTGLFGGGYSSQLMRLLQEAIHKKITMPSSCQELMNCNKHNYRFEPCF